MIHMYAIPTDTPASPCLGQPRMAYLTDSMASGGGALRAVHSHTEIAEISFVYEGHGIHYIDGREYHSAPGDILLYPANRLHQDRAANDGQMRLFLCGIIGLDAVPAWDALPPNRRLLKSGRYADFILQGFRVLEYDLKGQLSEASLLAQGFLQSLLAIIHALQDETRDIPSAEGAASLAEEMRQYIDQHYAQSFSLDDLAQQFHINRFYASHVFSECFGSSPMQYRTRRRIGEAQSLLTSTDGNITYIASIVGYDDPNRFTQVFSKLVGMSPRKYRDQNLRPQPPK